MRKHKIAQSVLTQQLDLFWVIRELLVFALALVFPANVTEAGGIEQPNILFIMVDDLGKEWISAYGAEGIDTPRIDTLASSGMRFSNAYSMPQCTPSRLSLLTGQYPFRHGWTNHFDVPRWGSGAHFDPERNPSFPQYLRNVGYATAIAGKWQIDDFRVEPRALEEAGFDAWKVWTGGEGGNLEQSSARYWDPYIHEGISSSTREGAFGPDLFTDFLIDFMKVHRNQPMFLYYPMVLTHTPLVATPDEPCAEERMTKHKAMTRYVDKLVGRLVDELNRLDIRERTIVIFTTDNGTSRSISGRRDGRTVRGGKAELREPGSNVPIIVNGPGIVPEGVATDELTDFTDLAPTFVELAGARLETNERIDGHSIAPLLLGQTQRSPRDWIMAMGARPAGFENNRVVPVADFAARVVRDKRWKLFINEDCEAFRLHDLKTDPSESINLIGSGRPEALQARKKLMQAVRTMPQKDAAPQYDPNPPQAWDKFDFNAPNADN